MAFVKKLTDNINLILKVGALIALMFTGITYFATQSDLDALAMTVNEDIDTRKRKELRQIVFECKTKYKDETNEFIVKTCRDAEIELEELKDKKG